MPFGLGSGEVPLLWMEVLTYSGSDTETIAAVASFNSYFSLTYQFGILAFISTLIVSLLARS